MIEILCWINNSSEITVRDVYNIMREANKDGSSVAFLTPEDLEGSGIDSVLDFSDGVAVVYKSKEWPSLTKLIHAFIKEVEEN